MRLSQFKTTIRYIMPNAKLEYDEAQRYDELREITLEQWEGLVATGQRTVLTLVTLSTIGNSTAINTQVAQENLSELDPEKIRRVQEAINSGTVEMPIVLKDGNTLDLLSGNTRLTLIVSKGLLPTVLVVAIPTTESNS